MKLFLVRHGLAVPRREWNGQAQLRPLNEVGVRQAEALADLFEGEQIARLVSGPSIRCQQTLAPVVRATGRSIEIDDRLERGEAVQRVLELMPGFREGASVFCTHREIIESLLRVFELDPRDDERDGIPCQKGSVWVLEGPGYTPTIARYLEPVGSRKRGRVRFSREPQESRRAAVLDLGSTSFNLLIADVHCGGEIEPVVREKVMLRLGAVIAEHEAIPDEVCESASAVARELRELAEREKVECLFPVGTAALRDADNGDQLADRIGRTLGAPVRVLSGEEEARLIYRAFRQRLALQSERVLALDLGGGSLEIATGSHDAIEYEATLRLGVARLHRELVRGDPIREIEAEAIRQRVRQALAPHVDAIVRGKPERCIATGGTIRALSRLADEERARRSGQIRNPGRLTRKRIARLCEQLGPSSHEERLLMRGMSRNRADLLPTGAIILREVMKTLGANPLTLCDWGLREGVLLDSLQTPA